MTTSPKASPSPKAAELTYRDVQEILALVDSWPGGHVRLAKGNLSVEAIVEPGAASIARRMIVRSSGVGIFQRETSLRPGEKIEACRGIGTIVAPGRMTDITAEETGSFAEWLVETGQFVEYGQALAAISVSSK